MLYEVYFYEVWLGFTALILLKGNLELPTLSHVLNPVAKP